MIVVGIEILVIAFEEILARPQIARELCLERPPNAARRKFFASADGVVPPVVYI